MRPSDPAALIGAIADEVFETLARPREIEPFSQRYKLFTLDHAYDVVALVRQRRESTGEKVVGRKIGFTNTAVWGGYGISGPIWNYLYDTTVSELEGRNGTFATGPWPNVRIEPEIALCLSSAPEPGMSERDLLDCIEWVSHGFEIVSSLFPAWKFSAADAAAAHGVHLALLLGPRLPIAESRRQWGEALSSFSITMASDRGPCVSGGGRNVLGGPVTALAFLVAELSRHPGSAPLQAGEIITTGTLTEARPALAGETWSTEITGAAFDGLRLRFT